jgi:hypothetical protein
VFLLEELPLLFSEENLGTVKLIISDGGSQEFDAINEGIFHGFKETRHIHCTYHIVKKTWEMEFKNNICFAVPDKADPLTIAIQWWANSWMDGSICLTRNSV